MAYPEPFTDEWYADNQPEFVGYRRERPTECDVCGWGVDVQSYGDMMLCAECRGKEYADEDPNVIERYMESNLYMAIVFFRRWMLSLPEEKQVSLYWDGFCKLLTPAERHELLEDYVMQCPEEITAFVEMRK